MVIHWQYSNGEIRAAYMSRRPFEVDLRVRLALGMGMFPEAFKPIKDMLQIDPYAPHIIEKEDGTMVYVTPQTCVVDTSCRVIVPQEGDHVFVGIKSKLNKSRQTVEDLIENVLIPVQFRDKGLIPIRSRREDLPSELL